MPVILGNFVFQDFEIPERIPLGGGHDKATHTLLGGNRVVDAMGPNERDITWTGRIQSADATLRSRALDSLRIAGQPLPLIVDSEFRLVLITDYAPVYERSYQIPYSITVHVINSPTIFDDSVSLDFVVAGDLSVSLSLSAGFSAGVVVGL
jgi:hypothetical protein